MGGQSIYEQLLPYCDVVHVTRIDQAYEADTYFPDLDQKPGGRLRQRVTNRPILIWNIPSSAIERKSHKKV